MKTTLELPDALFVAAKQRAAQERTTLRTIVERGLRAQLASPPRPAAKRRLKWVTVDGGLPPGLQLDDRESMHEWLHRAR